MNSVKAEALSANKILIGRHLIGSNNDSKEFSEFSLDIGSMTNDSVQKLDKIFKFNHPSRAGDGCDPFKRYQYCINEFIQAMQNLISPDNEIEINIHAMNCCLETYAKNCKIILDILKNIKSLLNLRREWFLQSLRNLGHFPSYQEFRNMTFKNTYLISLAKQLCIQVI